MLQILWGKSSFIPFYQIYLFCKAPRGERRWRQCWENKGKRYQLLQGISIGILEEFLHFGTTWTLGKTAWRSRGIFLAVDIQELGLPGPWITSSKALLSTQGWPRASPGSFPAETSLWFCKSVLLAKGNPALQQSPGKLCWHMWRLSVGCIVQ